MQPPAAALGSSELATLLSSLSLSALLPTLEEEDLTVELLRSMKGSDFVEQIQELGISAADAERLHKAL